ncbi:hypothetical protein GWZ74_17050 [Vibrio cholerae]|uniref:hypothetical protein n=1 Tax=Vibrio cholerae TaxID=666 RepID=UPI000F3E3027|nr:hypothetical protein [Vibrio cholerae]NOE85140.1 hypothetical protein [Vibrio cholerae]NOE97585.1 hypothetical protein [Vibrio cholerae]NOE98034.1 hypothetical protein [Vibrio cholerae]NOF13787.1 hypothetical protein [Vibrio cholerae]NOF18557.1 hypothetical protein [Vibrio cholerae]
MDKPEVLLPMFFAFEDALMLDNAADGAIEITEQQYNAALAAKMEGRKAFVLDGELVIFSGVMVTAWNKSTRQPEEFDEFDVIPEDYTLIEPVGDVVWGEAKWVERIKSPQELAQIEHYWVLSELTNVQIELMYHWTDDQRATSTLDAWKLYARQLRDYTTTDEQGTPSIRGDSRPVKPI